jgi:hypothetical protein
MAFKNCGLRIADCCLLRAQRALECGGLTPLLQLHRMLLSHYGSPVVDCNFNGAQN